MSEQGEYPGGSEQQSPDPFLDAVVRDREDGTRRSDEAVHELAKLGRSLAIATQFRREEPGVQTAKGLVELLTELGQKPLIEVAREQGMEPEREDQARARVKRQEREVVRDRLRDDKSREVLRRRNGL